MAFTHKIENAMAGPEVYFAESESQALWLARWLAASFAARSGITSAYNVYNLATGARIRTASWSPPDYLPIKPPWPVHWSYQET